TRHGGRHHGSRDVARPHGTVQELHDARCGGRVAESAVFCAGAVGCIEAGRARRQDRLPPRTEAAERPASRRHGGGAENRRGRNGMTRATNDIGIITLPDGRHLAIAVLVKDSTADEAAREGTIAKIAKAAWDRWTKR